MVVAAESTTDVEVQVNVPPVALAPGNIVFSVTLAVDVLVQPLDELVTVTEYTPAALTLGLAVVFPEMMPGPVQLKLVPVVVTADRTVDVVVHVR